MTVDCDGQRSDQCNKNVDPDYTDDTSLHQSDGKPLNAARTSYVVLPTPGSIWSYSAAGVYPGDVVAVIYHGHVEYAVFGDAGPDDAIGEASYATAAALGINPDPSHGGTGSDVTYIVFPKSKPSPVEDHDHAVIDGGRKAATAFMNNN